MPPKAAPGKGGSAKAAPPKIENFDEDPNNPIILKHEDIVKAGKRIRSSIIRTPCIPSHYEHQSMMNIYFKLENLQKSGSFKERGSLNALQLLPSEKRSGVVIASIGNDAVGFCYHASKLKIPVIVVMPTTVSIAKIQKCQSVGGKVVVKGSNLSEAQRYARAIAKEKRRQYIHGRDQSQILAGYGTVGLEIVEDVPLVDAILVPVGTGGLAAAVATVVKRLKPNCLIYGVQPESMPTFCKSLEMEAPVTMPMGITIADAIAVPDIGANAFANAQPLVDKMILVNEEWIARSILHMVEKERLVVEGAGACPLAAIVGQVVPELILKTVVCIVSGGNIDNINLTRCLERGLYAEGRLVKFSVGIKDTSMANAQLLHLLAKAGYNVVNQFQDRVWMDDETYTVEIKLVCETRGLDHALELKRIMERAYPCTTTFETQLVNDFATRTCRCYVRKSI